METPRKTRRSPLMLTVTGVSQRLNISPAAVRQLIRKGDLQAVNVAPSSSGAHALWRVDSRWLDEFLTRRLAASPRVSPRRRTEEDAAAINWRAVPDHLRL